MAKKKGRQSRFLEKTICDVCVKKHVDRHKLNALLEEYGERINELRNESVLLAEILPEVNAKHAKNLEGIIACFLRHGFDIGKNHGKNGRECLSGLQWNIRPETLKAAKQLLASGSDKARELVVKEEELVEDIYLESSFLWNCGDRRCANTYEAYYRLCELISSNDAYRDVAPAECCIGRTVTKVECAQCAQKTIESCAVMFHDAVILWFDEIPLICDERIYCLVDPSRIRAGAAEDVSGAFKKILGSRLCSVDFIGSCIMKLNFSNRISLFFTLATAEGAVSLVEIMEEEGKEAETIEAVAKIEAVRFENGDCYEESTKIYEADSVTFRCDGRTYALFPKIEGEKRTLNLCRIPESMQYRRRRTWEVKDVRVCQLVRDKRGDLVRVKGKCDHGNLCFRAFHFRSESVSIVCCDNSGEVALPFTTVEDA